MDKLRNVCESCMNALLPDIIPKPGANIVKLPHDIDVNFKPISKIDSVDGKNRKIFFLSFGLLLSLCKSKNIQVMVNKIFLSKLDQNVLKAVYIYHIWHGQNDIRTQARPEFTTFSSRIFRFSMINLEFNLNNNVN